MRSNAPLFYCSRLSVPLISALNILDKISSSVCHGDFIKGIFSLGIRTLKNAGGS